MATVAYTLDIFKTASCGKLIYVCTIENEVDNVKILLNTFWLMDAVLAWHKLASCCRLLYRPTVVGYYLSSYIHTYIIYIAPYHRDFKAHYNWTYATSYATNLHYKNTKINNNICKTAMLCNRKKVWLEEFFETGESGCLTNMLWEHIPHTGASNMKRLIPEAAICMWNVESGTIKRGSKQTVSGINRRIKVNVILQISWSYLHAHTDRWW